MSWNICIDHALSPFDYFRLKVWKLVHKGSISDLDERILPRLQVQGKPNLLEKYYFEKKHWTYQEMAWMHKQICWVNEFSTTKSIIESWIRKHEKFTMRNYNSPSECIAAMQENLKITLALSNPKKKNLSREL